jgi:hypothetical protein
MCNVKTFNGEMPSVNEIVALGRPVSTDIMHQIQAAALNPALKNCGSLPECRGCNILPEAKVDRGKRIT